MAGRCSVLVSCNWRKTFAGDGPARFFKDYHGYFQADAYSGYDALFQSGKVIEVGCWAHARRYFSEARTTDPPRAHVALAYIRRLYALEADAKKADTGLTELLKSLRIERSTEAPPVRIERTAKEPPLRTERSVKPPVRPRRGWPLIAPACGSGRARRAPRRLGAAGPTCRARLCAHVH